MAKLKYKRVAGPAVIRRVVIYARVSTSKQMIKDLSIPDQIAQCEAFCAERNYEVYKTFVEAGTATNDDHRSQYQAMISEGLEKPPPFDAIIVHSLSRFYRDDVTLEYIRRRLVKNGVQVISITQDFGEGAMADLTRRIMGIVDELNSKEISKHVKRTMIASAKDGWWTSAHAPFGYEIDIIEIIGTRKKRKLKVHPVNGSLVQLIFKLYLEGDGTSGHLGIKKIVNYLNEHGYTYKGKPFYTSHIETVLKNDGYTGLYYYNKTDSKEQVVRPRDEWIGIPVPQLVTPEDFQRVQVMLQENTPERTPPRITSSQVLLSGIAKCGLCRGSMKIMVGTGKNGTVYRYYGCSNRLQKGTCNGARNTIKEEYLDGLVIRAVIDSQITVARVQDVIAKVCVRRQEGRESSTKTLERLRHNLTKLKAAANNLLGAVAEGMVGDSDLFREKLQTTIEQRDHVQRLIEVEEKQMADSVRPISEMDAEVAARRLRNRLETAPKEVQKRLLRALIGEIVVKPDLIEIRGPEPALAETADAARRSEDFPLSAVHAFDRDWRPREDSNHRPTV